MIEIAIELGPYATRMGTLSVFDETGRTVLGPVPVAGRLSYLDSVAARASLDEQEAVPAGKQLGKCLVHEVHPMAGASFSDIREFGRYGMIALVPDMDEASSNTLRDGVAVYIHGGARGETGDLRPTIDSIRLDDRHLRELVKLLAKDSNVRVRIQQHARDSEDSGASNLVAGSTGRSLSRMLSALPLAFAAMPGLFPAAAEAQTQQCTQYDTGTNFSSVDFSMINLQGGGDALEGYVPGSTSGVTIAGGLDLGIYTSSQLTTMGFDPTQVSEWAPYLATSCGSLVGSAAQAVLTTNPLSVTSSYAQIIDGIYYSSSANGIASLYNQLVTQYGIITGHTFSELPLQYQTAMTAMDLTNTSFGTSQAFTQLAEGQWTNAIDSLRNYGSSNAAVNKLAHVYADYMARAAQPSF